jgi:hypothetical protein
MILRRCSRRMSYCWRRQYSCVFAQGHILSGWRRWFDTRHFPTIEEHIDARWVIDEEI